MSPFGVLKQMSRFMLNLLDSSLVCLSRGIRSVVTVIFGSIMITGIVLEVK